MVVDVTAAAHVVVLIWTLSSWSKATALVFNTSWPQTFLYLVGPDRDGPRTTNLSLSVQQVPLVNRNLKINVKLLCGCPLKPQTSKSRECFHTRCECEREWLCLYVTLQHNGVLYLYLLSPGIGNNSLFLISKLQINFATSINIEYEFVRTTALKVTTPHSPTLTGTRELIILYCIWKTISYFNFLIEKLLLMKVHGHYGCNFFILPQLPFSPWLMEQHLSVSLTLYWDADMPKLFSDQISS